MSVLVCLWFTSGIVASMMILFPHHSVLVATITALVGLFLMTVAYGHIYKVIRHHQKQLNHQLQLQNGQAMELLRERKSFVNTLFVYIVFPACLFPHLCYAILVMTNSLPISFISVAEEVFELLFFLYFSLNPLIHCWRHLEIREIVKSSVKKIFRINLPGI